MASGIEELSNEVLTSPTVGYWRHHFVFFKHVQKKTKMEIGASDGHSSQLWRPG
jgi:hypothetical protein